MPADLDRRQGPDSKPAILRLTPVPTVLRTAATIGLGIIPMHRLPRAVQVGTVLAPGVLTTGILLTAQRRAVAEARAEAEAADAALGADPVSEGDAIAPTDGATEKASAGKRWVSMLVLSGAMGAALAGASFAGIRIDRAIENALRRHDVRAPRLVMGLAGGVLSLGMDVLEARASSGTEDDPGSRPLDQSPDENA